MFEREAEDYSIDTYETCIYDNLPYMNDSRAREESFRDGATFGYNKANEWHFVKDGDLPNKKLEEKQLLVRVRNYNEDYIFAYYMLDKYSDKTGKRFYFDIDCYCPIDIEDVIAWKEIVLPALPKEIKEK